MNAVAQTFAIAFASVAAAATIGIGLANSTAEPSTDVAKLERVVVVGQRAHVAVVARLPRVVIEKRRAEPADLTVAQAHPVRAL